MNDEHVKLIAKIQHFYDVMIRRLEDMEDGSLSGGNDIESLPYREKCIELNFLSFEYAKTFETFLYKEPNA